MMAADSGSQPDDGPRGDARFRVFLMVPKTCDCADRADPARSPPTPVSPPAYIASVMASDADD